MVAIPFRSRKESPYVSEYARPGFKPGYTAALNELFPRLRFMDRRIQDLEAENERLWAALKEKGLDECE